MKLYKNKRGQITETKNIILLVIGLLVFLIFIGIMSGKLDFLANLMP